MELHELQRYIHDEEAAGRPIEALVMSMTTHDAIRRELRGVMFSTDCNIENVTIKELFGRPIQIED